MKGKCVKGQKRVERRESVKERRGCITERRDEVKRRRELKSNGAKEREGG